MNLLVYQYSTTPDLHETPRDSEHVAHISTLYTLHSTLYTLPVLNTFFYNDVSEEP